MFEQRVEAADGFAYGVLGADVHVLGSGVPLYLLARWQRPVSPPSQWLRDLPSRLLNARHRVVPFTGRRSELESLQDWLSTADLLAVRWLHGPGGQGKTRLADEVAMRASERGWLTVTASAGFGQVNPAPGSQDLRAEGAAGMLLIVDYADRWPLSSLVLLMQNRLLHNNMCPVRVLLLGRTSTVFAALRSALAETRIVFSSQELHPLRTNEARQEMLRAARDEFLNQYGVNANDMPAGLGDDTRLEEAELGLTLTLHMAALVAVDSHRHGRAEPRDLAGLTVYLLDREHLHWANKFRAEPHGIPLVLLHRAVFIASISGILPRDQALLLLRRLLPTDCDARDVAMAHADCYPPDKEGMLCQPLYPDRLAEDFIALTLAGHTADYPAALWAGNVLSGILTRGPEGRAPQWLSHAMSTLAACHLRWPHVGALYLYPLLRTDPALAVEAGGSSLGTLATAEDIDSTLLEAIEDHLPSYRHLDLDVPALVVMRRLAGDRIAKAATVSARADVHVDLGFRLNITGHREEAWRETERAVNLYRTVTEADTREDLGHALANLAHIQLDVGDRPAALASIQEALQLYQQLAAGTDAYDSDLAYAHTTLGTVLAALGRYEEAVDVCETAERIYRRLADANPEGHEEGLASAVGNLGLWLHYIGAYAKALLSAHEATRIYRRLAARDPNAYMHEVAAALINEAMGYESLHHYGKSVEVLAEAVTILRTLSKARPESFEHHLATSLSNISQSLLTIGRTEEAVNTAAESVAIRKRLAQARHKVFEPDLATGWNNLAAAYLAVGQLEAALAAADEAVQLRERLAVAEPAFYQPFLASALNNMGHALLKLERYNQAVVVFERAVGLYRALATDRPGAHREDLVSCLKNYGQALLSQGRPAEALSVTQEATATAFELAIEHEAKQAALASCLTAGAGVLMALAHSEMAKEVIAVAVAVYTGLPQRIRSLPSVENDIATAKNLSAQLGVQTSS